jgi:hypothetical protein
MIKYSIPSSLGIDWPDFSVKRIPNPTQTTAFTIITHNLENILF